MLGEKKIQRSKVKIFSFLWYVLILHLKEYNNTNLRIHTKRTLRGLYSHENGHENEKENGHGNGQENGNRNKQGK